MVMVMVIVMVMVRGTGQARLSGVFLHKRKVLLNILEDEKRTGLPVLSLSSDAQSLSQLCQTFCTSSFSSRASSSLPMAFSWSGSVRRVVVMGTMARSSDRIS